MNSPPFLCESPPGPAPLRRIVLVDDHPLFRAGLTQVLSSEPGFNVVGEAGSAAAALAFLRHQEVDVAIIDISLEGTNGLELIKSIKTEHPNLRLLVVSVHDEMVYAGRALKAGAAGYLMKSAEPELILQAVHELLKGEIVVSSRYRQELLFRATHGRLAGGVSPLDNLSDRELEVLSLLGQGLSSVQIGEKLFISTKTVESHRMHLKTKLNLKASRDLVRFALQWHEQESS